MSEVLVSGSFDDLRSADIRFLETAGARGEVHVLLWSDETVRRLTGRPPTFPELERKYLVEAVRYVSRVTLAPELVDEYGRPRLEELRPAVWAEWGPTARLAHRDYAAAAGVDYRWIAPQELAGFPVPASGSPENHNDSSRNSVVVTGCYDWLHSGHVRFFEEASQWGDLYVCLGNDENVRQLKGEGHPMFPQEERRYMVQAIRYVVRAVVSRGFGWMDAAPEIAWIKPRYYVVNEDGDRPEKQRFCTEHELEYIVLKRTPKEGLPRRESTLLRSAWQTGRDPGTTQTAASL